MTEQQQDGSKLERVIRKIKRCMALAKSANENEAATAMRQAQSLMREYRLTEMDTGARAAGVEVLWAANHWPVAVEWHSANHPDTQHICQDLHQADWTKVPSHDILLASPCCQGHSKARQVIRQSAARLKPIHGLGSCLGVGVSPARSGHRRERS